MSHVFKRTFCGGPQRRAWLIWQLAVIVVAVALILLAAVWQLPREVVEMLMMAGAFVIAPLMLFMKDGFRGSTIPVRDASSVGY